MWLSSSFFLLGWIGVTEYGGKIVYKANVRHIMTEEDKKTGTVRATGVRLADGREFKARSVVSNATRWDTFEHMMGPAKMPEAEMLFRCVLTG